MDIVPAPVIFRYTTGKGQSFGDSVLRTWRLTMSRQWLDFARFQPNRVSPGSAACPADVATPRTNGVGRHTSVIRRAPLPCSHGESSQSHPLRYAQIDQDGQQSKEDVPRRGKEAVKAFLAGREAQRVRDTESLLSEY
jgi:hypothetical protein